MSKLLIVIIVVAILLVGSLGLLFIIGGPQTINQGGDQSKSGSNKFEVMGVQVEILKAGSGAGLASGNEATAHYRGTLNNGIEFDSSYNREPYTFTVGDKDLIQGWNIGVAGMMAGEKRKIIIPPGLAYGEKDFLPLIPANSTLNFEIELLSIK